MEDYQEEKNFNHPAKEENSVYRSEAQMSISEKGEDELSLANEDDELIHSDEKGKQVGEENTPQYGKEDSKMQYNEGAYSLSEEEIKSNKDEILEDIVEQIKEVTVEIKRESNTGKKQANKEEALQDIQEEIFYENEIEMVQSNNVKEEETSQEIKGDTLQAGRGTEKEEDDKDISNFSDKEETLQASQKETLSESETEKIKFSEVSEEETLHESKGDMVQVVVKVEKILQDRKKEKRMHTECKNPCKYKEQSLEAIMVESNQFTEDAAQENDASVEKGKQEDAVLSSDDEGSHITTKLVVEEEQKTQAVGQEVNQDVKEKIFEAQKKDSRQSTTKDSNEDDTDECQTSSNNAFVMEQFDDEENRTTSPVIGQKPRRKSFTLSKSKVAKLVSENHFIDQGKEITNVPEEIQSTRTSPIIGTRPKDVLDNSVLSMSSVSSMDHFNPIITSVQENATEYEIHSDENNRKATCRENNESVQILSEIIKEPIFEECKAIVCQKCYKIWTNRVLKAIFKGNEAVTVNSKVTFGAIVLMNNWALKNISHNRDAAVRNVLERAGLGKNIKNMKMGDLSHWITGLMNEGKIKCCSVFNAIYRPQLTVLPPTLDTKNKERNGKTPKQQKDGKTPKQQKDSKTPKQQEDDKTPKQQRDALISNKRLLSPEVEKESYSENVPKFLKSYLKANIDKKEPLIYKQLGINIESIDISCSSTDMKRVNNGTIIKELHNKECTHAEQMMLKERSRLQGLAEEAFDLLPFEAENFYAPNGNHPNERYMTNRELLTLHRIFILDAEYPDAELLFKILFQILLSRNQILLIPDTRTMLHVLEKLRRDFNRAKARKSYSEFLSQNWDMRNVYTVQDLWSKRNQINFPKIPTIGDILSLFCLWKHDRQQLYISLSSAMEEMCQNTDLSSSDKLGLCVRLYARFSTFLYKENNPELAERFMCKKFTLSNISVTRETLQSEMRSNVLEDHSLEVSVNSTENEALLAVKNCLEAEKIVLETENTKTLKHYQKLLKVFEQKLNQYREINSNITKRLRVAEAKKEDLIKRVRNADTCVLLEELRDNLGTICKNKRKYSLLNQVQQTGTKRQRIGYVKDICNQTIETGSDTISENTKSVIDEILSKGVRPESVRAVIQTVMRKACGECALDLPDVIWIRKYAEDKGFLSKST